MHLPSLLIILAQGSCTWAKSCIDLMIPVNINARQAIFNQVPITDNFAAVQFSLDATSTHNGGNYTQQIISGYQTVTGAYKISAVFCRPNAGVPPDATVQLLIHGIGFDKTYWDLPFDNYANSYTNLAVDTYDFCTLAIDRFGIGGSFIPGLDPINLVQAPATMSSIYDITNMLRSGSIPDVPTRFSKVVHVGHSFGAFLSYLLVTQHPKASNGLVLTGFTFDGTWFARTIAGWNLHLASLNQPLRFGNVRLHGGTSLFGLPSWLPFPASQDIVAYLLNLFRTVFPGFNASYDQIYQDAATTEVLDIINGYNDTTVVPQNLPASYLTWSDLTANIYAFLYPPAIDVSTALFAEKTKQPTTVGELLTIGNAPATAPGYTGPVLMISGRQDNIYCGGDCVDAAAGSGYPDLLQQARPAFPHARTFETYVQSEMGHGMNFHHNATGYYEVVLKFLEGQGLGSG